MKNELRTRPNSQHQNLVASSLQSNGGASSGGLTVPEINYPKGGGALKGIDEKFEINPSNGTANFNIPLPLTESRNSFFPNLSFNYNSSTGNSPFGLGWSLDLMVIQRRTDKVLPRYNAGEEDVFMLSGGEDLVPYLEEDDCCNWNKKTSQKGRYKIRQYRPRIESDYARIEKVNHPDYGTFWRVSTKDNITTFYGSSPQSRLSDPSDISRIFKWKPTFSFDDKGNWIQYEYKVENLDNVPCVTHESNRRNGIASFTNLYLKRIRYGNQKPWFVDAKNPYHPTPVFLNDPTAFFELVLDYGAHDFENPKPVPAKDMSWPYRPDAFSDYKAGFEIRTNRLCQRVLLFHHFEELGEEPCLVRSLDLNYEPSSINHSGQAEVTYLQSIRESGYLRIEDGYSKKSLPPLEFEYQRLQWNRKQKTIAPENIMNAPVGLTNNYQWVDLYGEGISGILTEQGEGWFYKENLGNGEESVKFTRAKNVIPRPSLSGLSKDLTEGSLAVMDLENNGQKQVVVNTQGLQGFFELTYDENWQAFQAFEDIANVNFQDPNTKFLDLTGDGQPDLIMTENEVFVWYASNGKKGFKNPERSTKPFDENIGPAVIFNDLEQKIFLADMTGDGMKDIVRARNGEVCYWANMGYGKFGAKVAMTNAPWFDTPDLFNPAYLQFEDISGTGATDLIYFGKDHFKAYLNLSGNAWSDVHKIDPFFPINRNTKITVIDLLGNGTSAIVWSSDLPADRYAPMRYIDLMGGKKPHLLKGYKNNLGKEIAIEYKSSTHFYLQDKKAGKPWVTKLAFPVQVVSKLIVEEKVSNVRFTSAYSYHHGYYDAAEREFRGFGRVEQKDSEQFAAWSKNNEGNNLEQDERLYQPPVLTKTWFHTGAFLEKNRLLNQFEKEYWYAEYEQKFPCELTCFEEPQLKDAQLVAAPNILENQIIDNLCAEEWREALRACKGMMLRQEVFALDAKEGDEISLKQSCKPYSVATHNCQIQLLQPRANNQFAAFQVMESEVLQIQYERNELDPRIAHTLNVVIDDLGNLLETASVVYPRQEGRKDLPEVMQAVQEQTLITYSKNHFTNDVISPEAYRLRMPSETIVFELSQIPKKGNWYQLTDFENILEKASPIAFHEQPKEAIPQQRKIQHQKIFYYQDDLTESLPWHQLETKGLVFQTYQLAYTPELLTASFGDKISDLETLRKEGGYAQLDDKNWWLPSGKAVYLKEAETITEAESRFHQPIAYQDAFGNTTKIEYYKDYFLNVTKTEDAVGNIMRIEQFNFQNLEMKLMRDTNDNLFATAYDELGMVQAFAKLGKDLDGNGVAELDKADSIEGFEKKWVAEQNKINTFFQSEHSTDLITQARGLLADATIRFVYDWEAFQRAGKPVVVAKIQREIHVANLPEGTESRLQISFEYSDGLGNVVMQKAPATPGLAKTINEAGDLVEVNTNDDLRWLGNGRTVLNNKGNPVKQYEPYFSTTPQYEADAQLVEIGVTPILQYDALDRLIKTDFPDGSFSKVAFDAWQQTTFDQNDTVKDSQWYHEQINSEDKKKQVAAQKTELHYNTPSVVHLDTLGRPILSIEHNKNAAGQAEFYHTISLLDIVGNIQKIIDARDNLVMSYAYDLTNQRIYQNSMDSGERWLLLNAAQKPIRRWDGRNHCFEFLYDKLQRPLEMKALGGDKETLLDNVYEKIIYGEGIEHDKQFNLRGQVYCQFDTAGLVTHNGYDDGGKILETHRQFAKDYKTVVDWSRENNKEKLEIESFCTTYEYDALDRVIAHTTPDGSTTKPSYNIANLLEKIAVLKLRIAAPTIITNADKPKDEQAELLENPVIEETKTESPTADEATPRTGMIGTPIEENESPIEKENTTSNELEENPSTHEEEIIVKNIQYNEKGQRLKIQYGNGVTTSHQYDPNTFRLTEIKTIGKDHHQLQDLSYTYDPIGNITCIEDKAIPTQFFNNQKIEGKSEYTYDALYRLIHAEGREHAGQQNFGQNDNWQDLPFLKKYSGGDTMAWRNYSQNYQYDAVGNILQMQHKAQDGNWTRDYQYEQKNNHLRQTKVGEQVYQYPHHAQHGFITAMPHLQRMDWNFRDELQAVARQKITDGSIPETTYYVYDAKGQRVRKITDNACTDAATATPKNERLYLGTLEIYRVHSGKNKGLERTSLHVTEYFSPEAKTPEEESSENNKPLTEEEQKVNPTLGTEDTIANISRRIEASLLSSVFHPSLVMGKRIALIDRRNDVEDGTQKETIRYQLSNHLDSVSLELDGEGQVISYEEYHPYGTTAYQAIDTAIKAVAKRYRYTGKERDEESGLYYHGARYYLPWLGRWAKPDPGGMVDGVNGYSLLNSMNHNDLTGFSKNEEVNNQSEKTYGGDDGDILEDDLEAALSAAGIPFIRNQKFGENGSIGEIDFETEGFIIEVTVSPKRKGEVTQKLPRLKNNTTLNPTGKPVILLAPNKKSGSIKAVKAVGVIFTKKISEVVDLARSMSRVSQN